MSMKAGENDSRNLQEIVWAVNRKVYTPEFVKDYIRPESVGSGMVNFFKASGWPGIPSAERH